MTDVTETDPRLDAETGEVFSDEEDTFSAASTVDYDRIKRWVMQRDGKDYIQFAGLLDLLHQESNGAFTIHTFLEQAPTEANGMLAIVRASVIMGERQATGLGDASPGSVNRMIAPHLVRMAETRAKGRALRDLLNIPLVTLEELGPAGPAPAPADPRPTQSTQPNVNTDGLTVDGRWYTREQIWGFFQQRRTQMRERNLRFPTPALQRSSPLPDIVRQTQEMRQALDGLARSKGEA